MEIKFYPIDEVKARQAHEMMSFREYEKGEKTARYKSEVIAAYLLAGEVEKVRPENAEKAYALADRYAKKLADNYNEDSRIGCMCPSVMISGSGNFPVKKKERQVRSMDKNMEEYNRIQGILDRIKSLKYPDRMIKSSDEEAIEKLQEKVDRLTELQNHMKAVNAYFRKNKTLDGCPVCSEKEIAELKASMSSGYRADDKPFMSWELSNNNQVINSTKKRIEALRKEKERGDDDGVPEVEGLGFTVKNNKDIMRIQLTFDGKPDEETRTILKRNGFHWSPSNGCWQRQLNQNGRCALKSIVNALKEKERNS